MKNLEFGTYLTGDITQNFRIEMQISRSIISHLKNAFLKMKRKLKQCMNDKYAIYYQITTRN